MIKNRFFKSILCAATLTCSLTSVTTQADELIRHKIPGSDFPIAMAIEIPASATVVNLSGQLASVANPEAPKGSIEAYGDTETQTISTLTKIQSTLEAMGLSMADVVKMQVFLVGDPMKDGKMDFDGFMKGYTRFFGKDAGQPNLPTRSAFQVAGLAGPGYLVEIEVTAVRK